MVKCVADTVHFPVTVEEIAGFFSRIDNLQALLPPEIEEWESHGDQCSFHVKNIGKISMEKGFVNPDSEYEYIATADSKVDFNLFFRFRHHPEGGVTGYFEIEVAVNPLIEFMIKKPLTNLVNLMTMNLQTYFASKKPISK